MADNANSTSTASTAGSTATARRRVSHSLVPPCPSPACRIRQSRGRLASPRVSIYLSTPANAQRFRDAVILERAIRQPDAAQAQPERRRRRRAPPEPLGNVREQRHVRQDVEQVRSSPVLDPCTNDYVGGRQSANRRLNSWTRGHVETPKSTIGDAAAKLPKQSIHRTGAGTLG